MVDLKAISITYQTRFLGISLQKTVPNNSMEEFYQKVQKKHRKSAQEDILYNVDYEKDCKDICDTAERLIVTAACIKLISNHTTNDEERLY